MDEQELRTAIDAVVHYNRLGDWPQNLSDGVKALLSCVPLDPARHTYDFHCLVDPETQLCVICRIDHSGDECRYCQGRGYHKYPCASFESKGE